MPKFLVKVTSIVTVDAKNEAEANEIAVMATRCNGPVGDTFTIKFYDHYVTGPVRELTK